MKDGKGGKIILPLSFRRKKTKFMGLASKGVVSLL